MSLRWRLAAVAVLVLAATLAVVAALAFQLSRVQGRAAVDRVLRQELDELTTGLPGLLADAAAETGGTGPSGEELALAVERWLAVHPGSEQHLTVIALGADRLTTRDGPDDVLDLLTEGDLPEGRPGQLGTVSTEHGPMRVLTTDLLGAGGAPVGRATVIGPLAAASGEARDTLVRIATAATVGLLLGGGALVVATGRALDPLQRLAAAARATGVDDAGVRVPEPDRRDEVGVVAHEYNRMLDRLEAEAERRSALLAAISHELRTPVAVARGHLEVAAALGDDVDAARLAGVVRDELERLTRIIDDLSAVARGADGASLVIGPVFLPDLFDGLRDRIDGLGIGGVDVRTPPPLVLEADADRLTQALLNLVLNAEVHTPPGTAVAVEARAEGGAVVLAVTDDGPGVDPALVAVAFDPFVSGRPGGPGRTSGLGLSVVRTLAEAHGGRADLETSPAGTTVALHLPLPDGGPGSAGP